MNFIFLIHKIPILDLWMDRAADLVVRQCRFSFQTVVHQFGC